MIIDQSQGLHFFYLLINIFYFLTCLFCHHIINPLKFIFFMMQAPLELVGLGFSSSMDSFASWKMNGNGMEKEEREETPLQGEDESRRSSPP